MICRRIHGCFHGTRFVASGVDEGLKYSTRVTVERQWIDTLGFIEPSGLRSSLTAVSSDKRVTHLCSVCDLYRVPRPMTKELFVCGLRGGAVGADGKHPRKCPREALRGPSSLAFLWGRARCRCGTTTFNRSIEPHLRIAPSDSASNSRLRCKHTASPTNPEEC